MTPTEPEKTFRMASVSASVFANVIETDSGSKTVRNVVLQRRYRDGDEWKSSNSFGLSELPLAQTVLEMATQYVCEQEAIVDLKSGS